MEKTIIATYKKCDPGAEGTPGQAMSFEDRVVCMCRLSVTNQMNLCEYRLQKGSLHNMSEDFREWLNIVNAINKVYSITQIELLEQIVDISVVGRNAILWELFLTIVLKNQKNFDWSRVHVKMGRTSRYLDRTEK